MQLYDQIYGQAVIEEPVLLALLNSPPVQRLHGVLQHGISGLIGLTAPITRFEHSVGAMLLVRALDAGLQEQIAALLHDVSHTAFSHVIDYVFDDHQNQSYHEEVKEAYLRNTELPQLLADHGYDWRDFLHEEPYTLLEQPAPRLCADRLDYFLRDSIALELASQADVNNVLQHLVVHEERIVMDDVDAARWLAYTFIAADKASWANFREVALYELTARAIRRALDTGFINTDQLWLVDHELWRLLHSAEDAQIQQYLALVTTETQFAWDEAQPTFWVSTKLRSIDPDIRLDDGRVAPLSAIDGAFETYRRQYHNQRQEPWPVRVIPAHL